MYSNGNNPENLSAVGNTDNVKDGHEFTVPVGPYKANNFGLLDMHGNVWEWCEDWYGDYPAGAVTDPKGPATGEYRVLRGGSFLNYDSGARSSLRNFDSPSSRSFSFGFRLARAP